MPVNEKSKQSITKQSKAGRHTGNISNLSSKKKGKYEFSAGKDI